MILDEAMNQFRLASRELFNHFFRISNPYANTDLAWLLEERFKEIQDILFQKLVTEPSSIANVEYGDLQPSIGVKLRFECSSVMVNREIKSGYWDYGIKEVNNDATLLFLSYFDWDSLTYRDNQYVRVQISNWPEHSDVIGKHALIESCNVTFVLLSEPCSNSEREVY